MKINLTKLREMANKTGEGEDHVQKIRNAQVFVYSISPMLIVDLIDEIERLRGALEFEAPQDGELGGCYWCGVSFSWNADCTVWSEVVPHEDSCPYSRVRKALAAHRERFEE